MIATAPIPETKPRGPWPAKPRQALLLGVLLWLVPMLVVGVMVVVRPTYRTVSQSYHYATGHWWAGQNIYVGPSGMNYLPQFVLVYTPFHFMPLPLCELLWRLCAAGTLGVGLWKMACRLFPSDPERPFFWASLLTMPLCMIALRNGNDNAAFGGVVLLAIVAILDQRWWLATWLLILATALKPLAIVLIMLAPLYYAPLRGRLPIGLLVLAVSPFLFGRPAYVWSQHVELWNNLRQCAVVTEHRFADINGILRTFGTEFPAGVSTVVRAGAGALTAIAWLWGARRLSKPLAGLWLFALGTFYLMLFNPMNEENSYAILAPAMGIWAVVFLFGYVPEAAPGPGWAIVFMALTMGLLPNIVRPLFHNYFALFWHPLMAIIFLGILCHFVWRSTPAPVELQPQPAQS